MRATRHDLATLIWLVAVVISVSSTGSRPGRTRRAVAGAQEIAAGQLEQQVRAGPKEATGAEENDDDQNESLDVDNYQCLPLLTAAGKASQRHGHLFSQWAERSPDSAACSGPRNATKTSTSRQQEEELARLEVNEAGGELVGNDEDDDDDDERRLMEADCAWRFDYVAEQGRGQPGARFRALRVERSIDERLANIIYTAAASRIVNLDQFRPAGPRAGPIEAANVCGQHLAAMLGLLEDLQRRLKLRRLDRTAELGLNESHIYLARVLDSFGRYESGYFLGKAHSYGSYEQCSSARLLLGGGGGGGEQQQHQRTSGLVDTRYCWAQLAIDQHLDPRLKRRELLEFASLDTNLNVGICLPSSCNTHSFARNRDALQALVDSQFRLPQSIYVHEHLELKSIFCPGDPGNLPSPSAATATEASDGTGGTGLPLSGKLFLVVFLTWFGFTVYVAHNRDKIAARWSPGWASAADCLDLSKSWQEFIGAEPDGDGASELRRRRGKVELDALNLIKALGCAYVVLGHSLVFSTGRSMDSLLVYDLTDNDPLLLAMVVGTVIVDTFFVITGLLLTYLAMKRARRQPTPAPRLAVGEQQPNGQQQQQPLTQEAGDRELNRATSSTTKLTPSTGDNQLVYFLKSWFKFAANRYLRLVPLLTLVFWFKKGVLIHLLNGLPFWDEGANPDTLMGACKAESWLSPLLFRQAFLPLNKQCLPQAWSVSTDIFFGLTVAPIILILTRRPRLAALLGLAVAALSSGWAFYQFELIDPRMSRPLKDIRAAGFAMVFGSLSFVYTYPHYRFGSILVGVLVGYLLYKYNEQHEGHPKEWPQWVRGPATKAALALILGIFLIATKVPAIKAALDPHHKPLVVHLCTTLRVIWSMCVGVVFLRMASDWRHKPVVQLSSSKFLRVWVKLNFGILLVHMDYLILSMGFQTYPANFSRFNLVNSFFGVYLVSAMLATLLYVVFENPIDKLVKRHLLA